MQTFNDSLLSINKKLLYNEYDEDGLCTELKDDLLKLRKIASSDEETIRWIDFVSSINGDVNYLISGFAMELYEEGRTELSCYAYIRCIQSSGDSAVMERNNLAYIIRRRESSLSSSFSVSDIVSLLEEGLEKDDVFSIINMALTLVLWSGEEEDWRLADELFSNLKNNDFEISRARSWWENLANKNETEGYIALFFLLRTGKIDNCSIGTIESITLRIKRDLPSFPEWIAEE